MKEAKYVLFLLLFIVGLNNLAFGIDFGKRGMIFPVKEEGFVAMMIRKLKSLDLEKENKKMRQVAKDRVENPLPVESIKPANEDRSFYYDPIYTLDEDAVLPCGKILYAAGTKVNPLDYMDLERRIFFIDSREWNQVEWLKEVLIKKNSEEGANLENRVILVGGSIFKIQEELREVYGKEIYFDQMGELTTKWGIKATPAVVVQEGKMLRIDEFKISVR